MKTLEEIIEKIKKKTENNGDCWLFQGAQNKGYGVINFNYRMLGVHYLSAAYYLGLDMTNPTLQANHICTYKHCWNPKHIYVGTQIDNNRDARMWGQAKNQNTEKTHCKNGHEFTEENTYIKKGGRACKQCAKDYVKLYRESHRTHE